MRSRVREIPRVRDALVRIERERRDARHGWGSANAGAETTTTTSAAAASKARAARRSMRNQQDDADRPQGKRRQRDLLGRDDVHRAQRQQARRCRSRSGRRSRARPNVFCRLRNSVPRNSGAREERQEIEREVGQQPPLLGRVRDQEDRVERKLLGDQVGADQQRAEQGERDARPRPRQCRSNQLRPM